VRVTPFSPFAPSAAYSASTNGGSGYFDGTDDDLTVPTNVINVGTNDFCVEAWVYSTGSLENQEILGATIDATDITTIFLFEIQSNLTVRGRAGGSSQNAASTATIKLFEWNHIAFSRESGTLRLFINGALETTTTISSTNLTGFTQVRVGSLSSSTAAGPRSFNGYISSLRFVNSAVRTAAFTPPTVPLTAITNTSLLCNFTNAGIFDNTGKNVLETVADAQIDTTTKKYGTGSMEFDGTGDYLNCRMNSELSLGSGNWTIEAWLYFTSVSGDKGIVSNFSTISGPPFQAFGINIRYAASLSGIRSVFGGGSLADAWTAAWSPSTNTWYHFAATRSANSYRVFIDGSQIGSTETFTNATTIVNASDPNFSIGTAQTVASSDFQGFIDDLRITKGVARYTAAFTPPTAAFPNE
jgi:hypothetical protein